MSPSNEFQTVGVVELLRYVLAEGVAGASGRDAPAASVVGVRPKQVAHWAFVGDFLDSIELSDVVQGVDWGRQATVQAENLGKKR